jgi:hypothetical protein
MPVPHDKYKHPTKTETPTKPDTVDVTISARREVRTVESISACFIELIKPSFYWIFQLWTRSLAADSAGVIKYFLPNEKNRTPTKLPRQSWITT